MYMYTKLFKIKKTPTPAHFHIKWSHRRTFLWVNVPQCNNFALNDNAKAYGCCRFLEGHLGGLPQPLTANVWSWVGLFISGPFGLLSYRI